MFAHVGALNNGFHYDDIHSVVDNPHLRSLANPAAFLTDPTTFSARPERAMFRPLVVLSYAGTYALAGLAPWAYLLANLLTHIVSATGVLTVALVLGLPWAAAAGAALLFAVHPINSEVVNYVSSRSESFAAAGMLLALWAYMRWRSRGGLAWYVAALASFALALTSKATAIVLPAMLVGIEVWSPGRRRVQDLAMGLAPYGVLGGVYLWVVAEFAGRSLGDPVRPLIQQAWTQLKAASYYAHLVVVPTRLSVEHDFAVAQTPADIVVLLSAALVLSLALVGRSSYPRGLLLVCWAILAMIPASIVPLHVLVNEHRLYLASACLAILLSAGLWAHVRKHRGLRLAGILLVMVLAVLSRQRSQVWDSEKSLWSDAVRQAPNAYRAHMHLGGALEAQGEIVGALDSYRQAARLQPNVPETHYNLGNALRLTGHLPQARQAWERSLQQDPTYLESLLNLAAFHQDAGDWEHTWALLGRAERAHPQSPEVWRRKGLGLRVTGEGTRAEAAYLHSLELDPAWVETHYNLANQYYDERRLAEAKRHYTLALQFQPAHHGAANNLADLLLQTGDPVAAERLCRNTLRLDALRHTSGQSKLFYQLARALQAQGKLADALTNYRVFLRSRSASAAVMEDVRRRIEGLESSMNREP